MSKNTKDIIQDGVNNEIEIFGKHKTREEIKKEEKARRAAERKALREEATRRRKQAKEGAPNSREMIPVFIVCGVIVVLCLLLLVIQFTRVSESEKFDRDESNTAYYLDNSEQPEKLEDRIDGVVNEMYYTKGGYIAVRMTMSNGSDQHLRVTKIDVSFAEKDGTYVAGGIITPTEEVVILTKSTTEYTFYIAPEHITKKVTDFHELEYSFSAEGVSTVE